MNIAIYCGSTLGNSKLYTQKTKLLAQTIKKHNFNIVYGGSKAGIMGVLSKEAIKNNINITGVITYDLKNKEIANENITKLYEVKSIRERKEMMENLSDAFIALPGGFGTFEEIFEVLTNAQIGYHKKPIAFYNIEGYYNKLFDFLSSCSNNGFINKKYVDAIILSDDIEEILEKFKSYKAPKGKWEK